MSNEDINAPVEQDYDPLLEIYEPFRLNDYQFPGVAVRTIAQLIDIFWTIAFLTTIIVFGHKSGMNAFVTIASAAIVTLIVYAAFLTGPWQATPGKRLMGIYVIDASTGGAISFMKVLGRGIAAAFSLMLLWGGFLLAALTKQKITLHDFICSTRVVYRKNNERKTS